MIIKNTFTDELTADTDVNNQPRQVEKAHFSYTTPTPTKAPKLLHVSEDMARILELDVDYINSEEFLKIYSGNTVLKGTQPYAMCYGGHQFGHWAGQLGDGRAINLFQLENKAQQSFTLQLKGAGLTPYSRTADGLAVLRSSIREYLCAEAMFHLGIPTTRSLSLTLTGDQVLRDMLYDGHPEYESGAVVCRVAPSFIRFGNFQIFAFRQDKENLKKLADYTIKHHFKNSNKGDYASFFQEVCNLTLEMVIHWQRVGFVHGVMNTDNMSILGLTIDYGPYGWLEDYNPNWTPNTTDAQNRRYRFGQQGNVALWNLLQLANAIYYLTEEAAPLEEALNSFKENYDKQYHEMMLLKLGLYHTDIDSKQFEKDKQLIKDLEANLQLTETDMTIFFRLLSSFTIATKDWKTLLLAAFYTPKELTGEILNKWNQWFATYKSRLTLETVSYEERKLLMHQINPKYVLRNYMAQLAIENAEKGNYQLLDELYTILQKPYDEQPTHEKWFAKRPDWAREKLGCSMLSCSS